MLALKECKTADEVIANYKQVRDRVRRWHAPKRIPITQPEPAVEPVPVSIVRVPAPVIHTIEPATTETKEPPTPVRYPTIATIIKTVCEHYKVSKIDLLSERRTKELVLPRHVGMALAKSLTLHGLPSVGRHFGRDHTTVIHAVRKVTRLRAEDSSFDATMAYLESKIGEAT